MALQKTIVASAKELNKLTCNIECEQLYCSSGGIIVAMER